MEGVVTLAERYRLKLEAMRSALPRLDAALAAYARQHGGRFIRYGSSATGRWRLGSDIDLIADFSEHAAGIVACRVADDVCFGLGLEPDSRPADWVSNKLLSRALAEGVVLA